MGQDPEELRRDIAARRAEMAQTVDAIEDKVSPSRVVARQQAAVKGAVTGRLRGWRERIMGSPDDDYDDYYATSYAGAPYEGTTATYGTYGAGGGAYETTALAPDLPRQSGGGGTVDQARERASGMAHGAADRASGAAHEAAERARHAPEAVKRQAQGNPLAAGLVAFGAGLVAATLLPESRAERRAVSQVQPQLDRVAEEARKAGKEVADSTKERAQEEAQDLKESAADHAQEVKGHAQEAGQELKGHAQEAGKDVQGHAQEAGKDVQGQARQGGGPA